MAINPLQRRLAGVLLHATSLPSGKLDKDAEAFIDWMSECHLQIWQVLPLSVPDMHGSPYQSSSAFALDCNLLPELPERPSESSAELLDFIEQEAHWLRDFALFSVLKAHFEQAPWHDWPEPYRVHDADTLARFGEDHDEQIKAIYWQQFCIFKRWQEIREYANQRHIYLFGDMPIFVAYDSADVWANTGEFLLDENLSPEYVAGVPPDYFSATGQRWGNPHYNWQQMQDEGFSWWLRRMQHAFACYDIIRIDHFRGLQACWMIRADEPTAINGFWQETPGEALLRRIENLFDNPAIVAEDLGVITPEVRALRSEFNLPGMCILQFAFDAFDDNPHKPQNITPSNVVYSGTHDNDTTMGWFNALEPHEQAFVFEILQTEPQNDIAHCLVETALYTDANTAIFPLQDILQLPSEHRMNTPGQVENNWQWRFDWSMLEAADCDFLKRHIDLSGRYHGD